MSRTEWADLPNASLIDWVLEDSKRRPEAWRAARDAAVTAARLAAWDAAVTAARLAARGAARDAARGAARDAARGAARDAAWRAAWDAIMSLVAYDHSASYLDLSPEALALLVEAKDPPAILLQPYIHLLRDYK